VRRQGKFILRKESIAVPHGKRKKETRCFYRRGKEEKASTSLNTQERGETRDAPAHKAHCLRGGGQKHKHYHHYAGVELIVGKEEGRSGCLLRATARKEALRAAIGKPRGKKKKGKKRPMVPAEGKK